MTKAFESKALPQTIDKLQEIDRTGDKVSEPAQRFFTDREETIRAGVHRRQRALLLYPIRNPAASQGCFVIQRDCIALPYGLGEPVPSR
jgi:hypothetical protein